MAESLLISGGAAGLWPTRFRTGRGKSTETVPDVRNQPPHTIIVDGGLLRAARQRQHMSREKLAWKAEISITTIERLEQRPVIPRQCRDRTLARLAAALGEAPAALVPAGLASALGLDSDSALEKAPSSAASAEGGTAALSSR